MITAGVVLEIVGIFVIISAMVLIMTGDGSKEHKVMEYFLCGSLVQNIAYLLEWTAASRDAALTAMKFELLSCTVIPILYCWFLFSYCYEKPPKKLFILLAAVDLTMLPFILTLDRQPYLYSSTQWLVSPTGHGYLWLEYGPLYPIFMLSWMVVPYFLSLYVLIHAVVKRPQQGENRNYRAILLMMLLPISTYIAYALKLIRHFDPTPLALGVGLSLIVILIHSRRDYDFKYMASDVVLDSISDGVVALDDERRLVRCNRAAQDIFPQLRNCRVGERVTGEEGFWDGLLEEGIARTLELDGRFYESHAKEVVSDAGRISGHVLLVVDITDTRNYIDEIMEVRRQAEQASIAKSEFLANMSHEIRTPMNAIIGMSDIILEESRGRKVYSCAQDVQSAAKNLLAIINDILDLSKVEAGKMELVITEYHVRTLVNEVVGMMDMVASQRGLLMKHEFDMSMPCRYRGDEGRIKQILINLLNNAVKFTKEGGVSVSVRGMPGASDTEELVIFEVSDTGCGIREEDQLRIFDDFRQVDSKRNRSVEGTGLGLSIVKRLVQLMGGIIELKSVYGEGSTFTVTIPQEIADRRPLSEVPDVPREEAEDEPGFTAPGVRALIVDDNAVNRKVARGFLATYGLDLTDASSGAEAIELVKRQPFDIIFMDHMMPEMDGIEALQHIRSECGMHGRDAVIIALTANAMQGVREMFLESGFQDYIAKPLGRKPLDQLLRRWIPEEMRKVKTPDYSNQRLSGSAPSIPGIDVEALAPQYADGGDEFRELLELYALDGRRKALLLHELYDKGDMKNYEIEVHGLKSASANIGAMELSELAKAQEYAARDGDKDTVEAGFPALIAAYEALLSNIHAFLDGDPDAAGGASLPELGREALTDGVSAALDLLENFHSRQCADEIEALLSHGMSGAYRARLREIQEQLKLYEDDAAEDLLRALLKDLKA